MRTRLIISALAILSIAGLAAGQEQQPEQRPQRTAAEGADDRETMKARLQRRLQESRETQERLERAISLLEQGETTDRVREEAGGPMRRMGPRDRGEGPPGAHAGGQDGEPGQRPPPGAPSREAILRFLDEHNPELAGRLRETLRDNPEAGERIIRRIEPHFREIAAERDPEMRGYRIESMRLGWEILSSSRQLTDALRKGEAGAEPAAAARGELRSLLGAQFDLQVRMHDREIALLERRLAELRQRVLERTESRDSFIADKTAQIESMAQRIAERGERDETGHRDGGRKGPPRGR
jgi:hypothetical protein